MIRVLELRPNPISKSNGIDKYCKSLQALFKDDEVCICPVENYPMKRGKILKEKYAKEILVNILNNDEIDVVHINGFASFSVIQSFWYAHKANKKIVYTAHWHPFKYLNHPFRARVFFYLFLRPLIKRYANVITTINNEDTAFFRKFHSNVIQVPHWMENSDNIFIDKEKDPSMILFVGRFNDSNKGAEHLFQLPEGKYKIHCVGTNNGCMRQDMISHVNIPEFELKKLYSKASLLVVPSRYEAFSYVSLEALSMGTPVLLSDRVRIVDYLEGVNGVSVFKYHDYSDFVKKVSSSIGKNVDVDSVKNLFASDKLKKVYKSIFLQITQ